MRQAMEDGNRGRQQSRQENRKSAEPSRIDIDRFPFNLTRVAFSLIPIKQL